MKLKITLLIVITICCDNLIRPAQQNPVPPISQMQGTINFTNLTAGATLSSQAVSGLGSFEVAGQDQKNIQIPTPSNGECYMYVVNDTSLKATSYIITAQTVNISGALTLSNNANLTIIGDLHVTANTTGYFVNITQGCTLTVTGNITFNGTNQNSYVNVGTIKTPGTITITGEVACNQVGKYVITATSIAITGYLNVSNSANLTINGTLSITQALNASSNAVIKINGKFSAIAVGISSANVVINGDVIPTLNAQLPMITLSNNSNVTTNGTLSCSSLNMMTKSNLKVTGNLSITASTAGYFVTIANGCTITVTENTLFDASHMGWITNDGTIASSQITAQYLVPNGFSNTGTFTVSSAVQNLDNLILSNNEERIFWGNIAITATSSQEYVNIAQGCTLTIFGNLIFDGNNRGWMLNAGTINATEDIRIINHLGLAGTPSSNIQIAQGISGITNSGTIQTQGNMYFLGNVGGNGSSFFGSSCGSTGIQGAHGVYNAGSINASKTIKFSGNIGGNGWGGGCALDENTCNSKKGLPGGSGGYGLYNTGSIKSLSMSIFNNNKGGHGGNGGCGANGTFQIITNTNGGKGGDGGSGGYAIYNTGSISNNISFANNISGKPGVGGPGGDGYGLGTGGTFGNTASPLPFSIYGLGNN